MFEQRKYHVSVLLSFILLILLPAQVKAFGFNGGAKKTTHKVSIPCVENGDVELSRNWNWHYPKETPKIKNGNKGLRCASGKLGWLYTRSDIQGKYFVANDKWVKSTPIMDSVCGAIQTYCNPGAAQAKVAYTSSKPIVIKSWDGKVDLQIPAKVYTRAELLVLASDDASEVSKVFSSIDWFRAGELATMDALPQGKYYSLYSKLLGFNAAGTQIRIAHNISYKHLTNQVMIATWDIKSKQLQQLMVLTPKSQIKAVSADQHWLAIDVDDALTLYDSQSGEPGRVLFKNKKGRFQFDDVSFSSDGHYLGVSTKSLTRNADDSVDALYSFVHVSVFDVKTGDMIKEFSESFGIYNDVSLTFSPNSSAFFLRWEGDDYVYDVGTVDTWKVRSASELNGSSSNEFSADSQYVMNWRKLYNVKQGTIEKDYKGCEGRYPGFGDPVLGTPLNLYLGNNTLAYHQIVSGQCVTISNTDLPESIRGHRMLLFSKDRQQILVLTEDKQDNMFAYVINSHLPDTKAIAKAISKKQNEVNDDKFYDNADKMFKAGFHEEALAMMSESIEKTVDNPKSTLLAIVYIMSWAPEIPLVDVGKALLRHRQLILAQPSLPADGLIGGKNLASGGFIVETVFPSGNAERAGLMVGDAILAVNGVPVADEPAFNTRIKHSHPGETVNLSISRNGSDMTIPLKLDTKVANIIWAAINLSKYGVVAAAAGHSDLTLTAAKALRKFAYKYRSSMNIIALNNFALMLESLSMASRGDSDGAYKYAVTKGGFVQEFDVILAMHFNDLSDRRFLTPLFKNRKKLAFLLGLEEEKLPATPTHIFAKQSYPDLDGNIVGIGKTSTKTEEVEFELLDE